MMRLASSRRSHSTASILFPGSSTHYQNSSAEPLPKDLPFHSHRALFAFSSQEGIVVLVAGQRWWGKDNIYFRCKFSQWAAHAWWRLCCEGARKGEKLGACSFLATRCSEPSFGALCLSVPSRKQRRSDLAVCECVWVPPCFFLCPLCNALDSAHTQSNVRHQ